MYLCNLNKCFHSSSALSKFLFLQNHILNPPRYIIEVINLLSIRDERNTYHLVHIGFYNVGFLISPNEFFDLPISVIKSYINTFIWEKNSNSIIVSCWAITTSLASRISCWGVIADRASILYFTLFSGICLDFN